MKSYFTVNDVIEILGVSKSKAYKVIREMNDQLAEEGYLIVAGKVPRNYFEKRWYGSREERMS